MSVTTKRFARLALSCASGLLVDGSEPQRKKIKTCISHITSMLNSIDRADAEPASVKESDKTKCKKEQPLLPQAGLIVSLLCTDSEDAQLQLASIAALTNPMSSIESGDAPHARSQEPAD